MSSRQRVEIRAERIYTFLRDNLNTPYRYHDLLRGCRIEDSATTRRAIKHARAMAEAAGLHFPVACPANGHSYCVTNDPAAAFDPVLHLARVAQGVDRTKKVGVEFMEQHVKKLTPDAAAYLSFEQKLEAATAALQETFVEATRAIVAARKESRANA